MSVELLQLLTVQRLRGDDLLMIISTGNDDVVPILYYTSAIKEEL